MPWWPLAVVFFSALIAAGPLNAAVYGWAWDRRLISPWQATPDGCRQRGWLDRLPVWGWLRLRRDRPVLGNSFWIRPLLVELLFGLALAALYWWEVDQLGLSGLRLAPGSEVPDALWWHALAGFVWHSLLAWLMLTASLIDIDEKTIPDEVTVYGTLLGIVLATLWPIGLLPVIQELADAPAVATPLMFAGEQLMGVTGEPLWLAACTVASPSRWPQLFADRSGAGLAVGLACYGLWCFALIPRRWRTRYGWWLGLLGVMRRVVRMLRRPPLSQLLIGGVLWITATWFTGGAAWVGLLSALVGLVAAGGIVWIVRIVGSAALGREAMGFGDVTLMMMVGTFVGWQAGLVAFFLAPIAGLAVGLFQLLLGRGSEIPYGPYLCLATAGVIVGWNSVWMQTDLLFAEWELLLAVLFLCMVMLGLILGIWQWIKVRVLGFE